jgi:hypothetical protein
MDILLERRGKFELKAQVAVRLIQGVVQLSLPSPKWRIIISLRQG